MSRGVTIVAHRHGATNAELVRTWRNLGINVLIATPEQAADCVLPGEAVLARLDVLETLDGIEPGLEVVEALECRAMQPGSGGGPRRHLELYSGFLAPPPSGVPGGNNRYRLL